MHAHNSWFLEGRSTCIVADGCNSNQSVYALNYNVHCQYLNIKTRLIYCDKTSGLPHTGLPDKDLPDTGIPDIRSSWQRPTVRFSPPDCVITNDAVWNATCEFLGFSSIENTYSLVSKLRNRSGSCHTSGRQLRCQYLFLASRTVMRILMEQRPLNLGKTDDILSVIKMSRGLTDVKNKIYWPHVSLVVVGHVTIGWRLI